VKRVISREVVVAAVQEQISCDLAGEVGILNLKDGEYYSLNSVGARIWNLIHEPKSVTEIRDLLLQEYQVEPECCEGDLLALLEELATAGLIEFRE
jgi:hypothetical protein